MKKRKKWITLVIVLTVMIGGTIIFARGGSAKRTSMEPFEDWSVATAYIGQIRVTTEGDGILEPSDKTTYASNYNVVIERSDSEPGDVVLAGDVLAVIDPDSIQGEIDQLEKTLSELDTRISNMSRSGSSAVTSPVAGRVKRIFVTQGDILTDVMAKFGGLMEISADGKLRISFSSQNDLDVGKTVKIVFLDYEVNGTVVSRDGNDYVVTIRDDTEYPVDTPVEVKDDAGNIIGEGVLQSNAPYYVTVGYGRCKEISVTERSRVYVGTTLLTREDIDYNDEYQDTLYERQETLEAIQELRALGVSPVIQADTDGILTDISLVEGQIISKGSAMYTLISTDRYWLKVDIDELDIDGVKTGQDVTIVFDAFEDEAYAGTVKKVSALGRNTGGVTRYTVTVSLPGEGKLKPGMSATATITLKEKDDALLIPVDSITSRGGDKYVTVFSDGEMKEVPVILGLVNNTQAEVTAGLVEGQQVLIITNDDEEDIFSQLIS